MGGIFQDIAPGMNSHRFGVTPYAHPPAGGRDISKKVSSTFRMNPMTARILCIPILLFIFMIPLKVPAQQAPPRESAPAAEAASSAERASAPATPANNTAVKRVASAKSAVVRGRIIDRESGHGIEYASVVLHRSSDSSMVQGTISRADGRFAIDGIDGGLYYLEISFMGYERRVVDGIRVRDGEDVRLGEIALDVTSIELEEVEVAADRAPVSYEIDKKVINVERQITATSGSAVDVLQNVPSVTVDLDGTVRLRGSGSFTVLIDGRPSTLDASEALEQIPSSAIESIEIITNPSAKYDPEGVSGIINVIMKKGRKAGTTGVFNLNGGFEDRYGADFLLTQRTEDFSFYFGADYSKRTREATEREQSRFFNPDGNIFIDADGRSRRWREGYDVRGGIELPFTSRDNLNLGLRYGYREYSGGSTMDYIERFPEQDITNTYISRNQRGRGGNFFSGDLDYVHRFEGEQHELRGQISYRNREGEEESTDELLSEGGLITSGRRSTEAGPGERLESRLDYMRPLGRGYRLETGYQSRIASSEDATTLSEYDPVQGAYVRQSEYTRATNYDRNIHALYSMLRGEEGDLGFQFGLRGEYTGRSVAVTDTAATFEIDRWDYFPTLHTSYSFSGTQQVMASYTRRIDRPRGWFLEPFLTWMDAYNVRRGNPDLEPEYIDAWELGYQTHLGDNLISVEGYHRVTRNKVEYVRSVFRENVTLREVQNVGEERASGVELMFNVDAFDAWDIYLLGNLYDYRIEGELRGQSFAEQRFTWNVQFNNTFTITPTLLFQMNLRYNSPSVSAQGSRSGYFVTNLALRKDFFDRRFSATLEVDDLLNTAEREYESFGPDFRSYGYHLHDAPVLMLNLRYNLNQSRREEQRRPGGDGDFGDDEF